MPLTRTISAFNTATASENKIHDDAVASRFGFTGGLVPGVDVFAYLAHAPAALWGRPWLSEGAMRARFIKPVYDGDEATLTVEQPHDGELALSLVARGQICATGVAQRRAAGPRPPALGAGRLPALAARPKASPESLKPGLVLGVLEEVYTAERGRTHLDLVREDPALFDDGAIANPAYLLRRANYVLAANVLLGPWIHVESDVRLHDLLRDGETFEARAIVANNEETNGHLIVTLDFTITVAGRLIMSGRHWAIYEPRQVRERT
jgi:acyl dehydratase